VNLSEQRRRIVLGASFLTIIAASLIIFRPGPAPAAMLACLPPGDGPVLFVNVEFLRKAGVLDRIAGPQGEEEPEYRRFVDATHFDYRHDLDSALVEFRSGTALMVLHGRVDPDQLMRYAWANGGKCAGAFCSMQGSRPERQISFHPLGGRMVALAAGTDPMGAASIKRNASTPGFEPPSAPVWINLPGSALHAEPELPLGISAFLEALNGAQRALMTLEMTAAGFEITLAAPCDSADKAKAIVDRLSGATAKLQELLARSGTAPDAASPAAVLAAGRFSADQTVVRGRWPLAKAFLEGLAK